MINFQDLSYHYSKKKALFEGLTSELPAGNIYGLLGQNGAGKSTLLKILSGLLFPKAGQVDVIGFTPSERDPAFLREIFMVAEEFFVPEFSIERYVQLYAPFYPRFNREALELYMKEFHLPSDQKLNTYSYGQKKKFLLSFGLATDCQLLILDEPTNGLDIPSKSQFRKVVADAIHEDRTFLISTHQVRDMEMLIDPIIVLDEGEIIFQDSYEAICQRLTMKKVTSLPADPEVIYSEDNLGFYTIVTENRSGQDSNMNLELFFNAVVNNKEKIHQVFQPVKA